MCLSERASERAKKGGQSRAQSVDAYNPRARATEKKINRPFSQTGYRDIKICSGVCDARGIEFRAGTLPVITADSVRRPRAKLTALPLLSLSHSLAAAPENVTARNHVFRARASSARKNRSHVCAQRLHMFARAVSVANRVIIDFTITV